MKLVYREMRLIDSGDQMLMYDCNVNLTSPNDAQELLEINYPDAFHMIEELRNVLAKDEQDPPIVGDVIWTYSPNSNVYIAHCIIYENDGSLNMSALELCCKSVSQLLTKIEHESFAMPLMGIANDLGDWHKVYKMIEEHIPNAQGFVYIPTNEEFCAVIDGLPGDLDRLDGMVIQLPKDK